MTDIKDAPPGESSNWVKLQTRYDDAWSTLWPLRNLKIQIDGETVVSSIQINLQTGASEGNNELEIITVLLPKDGAVMITAECDVREKEIFEQRAKIMKMLHNSYTNLTKKMSEFQAHWDENPTMAYLSSTNEGLCAGKANRSLDAEEIFKADLWIDLSEKVEEIAATGSDALACYNAQYYDFLKSQLNKNIVDPEDTLYNWAWWHADIETEAKNPLKALYKRLKLVAKLAREDTVAASETGDTAKKIYMHRNAILDLPNLMARGDPKIIQNFVETVLKDIDPELARTIRHDPNFAIVLELIADHDSVLGYLTYLGLMLEAIPPNFYAYVAGEAGAHLMIEVVLLTATCLLSTGTVATSRVAMLVSRFAANANTASTPQRLKEAKAAMEAFVRGLTDLSRAAHDFQKVGEKLIQARGKNLVIRGQARTTLEAIKPSNTRDKKCRICGSTTHSSHHQQRGILHYE